jgi:hypothetical protein
MVNEIRDDTGSDHNQSEQERADAKDSLMLAAYDRKSQQQNGRNSDRNRSE